MSATTLPAPTVTAPRRRLLRWSAGGYSAAWIAGLAVSVPAIAVDASPTTVLAAIEGSEGATLLRATLVHGVAAIALAGIVLALARRLADTGAGRAGRAVRGAGLTAAGLSLMQLALEVVLVRSVAGAADPVAADRLLDAVNRIDGVKMLALAALVGAGSLALRQAGLPAWLRAVGAVGVPALVVSAAGYGLLAPAFAPAAYLSLPLLLVWVTGTGLALVRGTRR